MIQSNPPPPNQGPKDYGPTPDGVEEDLYVELLELLGMLVPATFTFRMSWDQLQKLAKMYMLESGFWYSEKEQGFIQLDSKQTTPSARQGKTKGKTPSTGDPMRQSTSTQGSVPETGSTLTRVEGQLQNLTVEEKATARSSNVHTGRLQCMTWSVFVFSLYLLS